MLIKTWRHHFTPFMMAAIQKLEYQYWQEYREIGTLCIADGSSIKATIQSSNFTSMYGPKELKAGS